MGKLGETCADKPCSVLPTQSATPHEVHTLLLGPGVVWSSGFYHLQTTAGENPVCSWCPYQDRAAKRLISSVT